MLSCSSPMLPRPVSSMHASFVTSVIAVMIYSSHTLSVFMFEMTA